MAKGKKKAAEPKTLAERTVQALRKHFKNDDVALLMKEGGFARVETVAPTGLDVLDRHVIGIGGLPYGRIVELKGEESAGKTTLLSAFMGAGQRDGALVAFRDAENKFNPEWGALHRIDVGSLILLQGETLEEFHEEAIYLLETVRKGPLIIALDSIANIPTMNELNEGKDLPAEHARLWPPFLRKASLLAAKRQALLIFVNQIRMKVNVQYGNPETTFAGRALKHAYSLRLHVSHGQSISESNVKTGRYMHVTAEKNQLAPPYRKAVLKLDYLKGFDNDWSTFEHAKAVGCIDPKSSYVPAHLAEARANLGWA